MRYFSFLTFLRTTFLVITIFLAFYWRMGEAPLFDIDEGAFVEASREMMVSGDYLHPMLNGLPRYDKPVLIYWLQASSMRIFGLNEWAARFPSALFASIWVMAAFFMARYWYGRNTAFWAAFLQATSLMVLGIGRAATADAVLNACLAIAMFAIFVYTEKRQKYFLYLAFFMMGAAFLTKGPIAVFIPIVVSFLYVVVIKKDWRFWLRSVFNPLGLFIFGVIALPWYIYMLNADGMAFVNGFFMRHNVARFMGPLQGHGGSLVYYVPVFLVGTLPHTALALWTLRQSFVHARDAFGRFALLWFFFVFFFFSLSGTKLPHYMLYGMTGLFVLMAKSMEEALPKRILLVFPVLFIAMLAALPWGVEMALPWVDSGKTRILLQEALAVVPNGYFLAMLAVLGILVLAFFFFKEAIVFVSGIVFPVISLCWVLPWVSAFLQAPVKEAAFLVKHETTPVVAYKINQPSFSFYLERIVEKREPLPLEIALAKRGSSFPFKVKVLYEKGPIVLVQRLQES